MLAKAGPQKKSQFLYTFSSCSNYYLSAPASRGGQYLDFGKKLKQAAEEWKKEQSVRATAIQNEQASVNKICEWLQTRKWAKQMLGFPCKILRCSNAPVCSHLILGSRRMRALLLRKKAWKEPKSRRGAAAEIIVRQFSYRGAHRRLFSACWF